jgi:UDP-2,3-diacylglucosamine pyrophosphatase LpxH
MEGDGVLYVNCGDWVDSCTAIVEHLNGQLELVEWRHASTNVVPLRVAA